MSSAAQSWAWRLGQLAVSVAVLVALFSHVDRAAVATLVDRAAPGWLLLAMGIKWSSLVLHEVRLWVSLNPPRPPLFRVIQIGFASGVLNLVLPGRAGDLAAIGMLVRECRLSAAAAAAAVGVVAFLEAFAFAGTLLVVLWAGADHWRALVGPELYQNALSSVGGLVSLGVFGLVAVLMVGRRFGGAPPAEGPSPLALIRDTLTQATDNLSAPVTLALNVGLSVLQVAMMIWAFALIFPAVGVDVALPALLASGVLLMSSLASVLLPPTYGAGPAAAATLVLGAVGLQEAEIFAYTAGWWAVSQLPAIVTGIPALRGRGERSPIE